MTQPSALRTAHAAPVPAWYRQVTAEQWKTFLTTFDSLDFGLGNAYAYTISVITLCLALIYFRLLYRRGDFEA